MDKSLARLGTDYLDLLQIHWPDRYGGSVLHARLHLTHAAAPVPAGAARCAAMPTPLPAALVGSAPPAPVPLFGMGAPFDASLQREGDVPFEEQLEALQRVVDQGKVRYLGVSNETSYGAQQGGAPWPAWPAQHDILDSNLA